MPRKGRGGGLAFRKSIIYKERLAKNICEAREKAAANTPVAAPEPVTKPTAKWTTRPRIRQAKNKYNTAT